MSEPDDRADEHERRLKDGWALWEGGPAYLGRRPSLLAGLWPEVRYGRTEHVHRHIDGPYFGHKHPGGGVPHDHEPGDRQLPGWAR
jgi:hypothetical protein